MSQLPFKKTLLTTAIAVSTAHASTVTDAIDYQYFRDFAENKGKFAVGASNIEVIDKQGNLRGTMFADGTPMVDFSSTSLNGVAHLIDPQYIASAKHNGGYTEVQFGSPQSRNHAERNFTYRIVDRNNKAETVSGDGSRDDYHLPRLHKLVTEVAPTPVMRGELKTLENKELFPHIVRTGAGEQWVRPAGGGSDVQVAGAYQYLVGGNILNAVHIQGNGVAYIGGADKAKATEESKYGVMPALTMGGDSGSPIYAFDKEQNQWVAISVHHGGNKEYGNWAVLHKPDFIDSTLQDDKVSIVSTVPNGRFNWLVNGNVSTISNPADANARQTFGVYDPNLANPNETLFKSDLNHGKSVHFTGEDTTLRMGGDIHQGAGALYFDNNMTVFASRDDATWVGAGVSVADGKTVNWRMHNPQGDRLSKVGKGTLNVSGRGENLGDISVGDGKVILNQQADTSGKKQAFNSVHIASGRGTVVLGDSSQVNADKIVFGYRGGRLDLNGNDITINRLRTVDDGAKIVNHNATQSANLTLTAQGYQANDLNWLNFGQAGFGLYEYKNNHRNNRLDYFVLKSNGNPRDYFPTEANSNNNWEFLGHSREEAVQKALQYYNGNHQIFQGNLGELVPSDDKPNHALNVTLNANEPNKSLVLAGNVNLNGTMTVNQGRLLLSGSPTVHAYDHQKNQDVIKDDEWQNRQFTAKNFVLMGGELATSRNVSQLTGDITASGNAKVNLGFVNGESEVCYRSDFSGKIYCNTTAIGEQNSPTLAVAGNVNLKDTASLTVANANIAGSLNAQNSAKITLKNNAQAQNAQLYDTATLTFANTNQPMDLAVSGSRKNQVMLNENAHWRLPQSTTIGHLDGKNGSQITLNDEKIADNYQKLTLNGDLTGSVQFNYLSNVATGKTDMVAVHGYATGSHTLAVKNTGVEAGVDELTLMELKHAGQSSQDVDIQLKNGFVDAGTWRYTLKNDDANRYYLFNEQKANEIKAQKQAEVEKAKRAEEQAKKALEDAVKAREDAEKALKTLQASSGATATDLANAKKAQKDAEDQLAQAINAHTIAQADAQKTIDELNAQLTNIQNANKDLQTDLDKANDDKVKLQENYDNLNRDLRQAQKDKDDLQKAFDLARQNGSADLDKLQAQLNDANKTIEQKQNELANLSKTKEALDKTLSDKNGELTNIQSQLTIANNNAQRLQENLNNANQSIADWQTRFDNLQTDLNKANNDKVKLQETLDNANDELTQARKDKDDLQKVLDLARQNGSNEVKALQEQLDRAQDTVLAKQGELDALTTAQTKNTELITKLTAQLSALQTNAQTLQNDLDKAQADAQKTIDELNAQLTNIQNANKDLQTDLDKANDDKVKLQENYDNLNRDLRQAQKDKDDLQKAFDLARQNGSADLDKLQAQLNDANKTIEQKQNELANLSKTKEALDKTLSDKNGELTNIQSQLTIANDKVQQLQGELDSTNNNAKKLQSDLDKAQSNAKKTIDELNAQLTNVQNANQDLQNDLGDANNKVQTLQGDLDNANAELTTAKSDIARLQAKVSELTELHTKNTEQSTRLLDDANALIDTLRNDIDSARKDVETLTARLADSTKNGNANQAVADALQKELDNAKQSLTDKTNALAQAQKQADDMSAQLLVIQNQTRTLESKLTQAQSLTAQAEQAKEEALIAKREAENAKQLAVDAQNKSEAEKKQAQDNLVKAEALVKDKEAKLVTLEEQKQALTEDITKLIKVQENLQATLSAQTTRYDALKAQLEEIKAEDDLAKAEAERLKAELAKAEAERLATLAQNKKQDELISQYANTALSEVSASAHHLMNMGEGVNERLLTLNRMHANNSNTNSNNTNATNAEPQSAIWAHTNAQKTKYDSELYRGYEQDTQLIQLGIDTTLPAQSGTMTVGASLNRLTHDADYADNFTGEGQTTTGTLYGKWQNDTGLAFTADISAGQAKSDIKQGNTTNDIHVPNIKRDVASIGVGMAKTWQAVGTVDVQVHAGLKHHKLGEANYDIHVQDGTKVNVKQDDIDITSLNAGINVGKHLQTQNGLTVRPNIGVNYRHTNSDAVVHINNQALAQKFDSELHTKAGIIVSNNTWELDVHIDHADGKETSSRVGGGVGVSWRF